MSLPFLISVPEKFEPRKHPGRNPNLSPDAREILDQLDILEQKADFGNLWSVRAFNLALVVGVVVLFVGGPVINLAYQKWRENLIGVKEQRITMKAP